MFQDENYFFFGLHTRYYSTWKAQSQNLEICKEKDSSKLSF